MSNSNPPLNPTIFAISSARSRIVEGWPSNFAALSPTRGVRANWETNSGLHYNKHMAKKDSVTLEVF